MGILCVHLAFIRSCQGSAAGRLGSKALNPIPVFTKPLLLPWGTVGALMYISFLFLLKQTLFTLLHGQVRRERIWPSRVGMVWKIWMEEWTMDTLPFQRMLKFHGSLWCWKTREKYQPMLQLSDTEQVKKAQVKITRKKTINHGWEKLKKAEINEKTFYVHRLECLILLKCPYYPKKSTGSMPSIKTPMAFFCRNRRDDLTIHMEPQKTLNI